MVNHHQGVVTGVAFTAALTALVAVAPQQVAAAFEFSKEIVTKCQEKWQVSKEIIEEIQRNKGELPDEDSAEQRCFEECVAKEMGVINNGGGVAADKIVDMLEAVLQMASKESGEKFKLDSRAVKRDIEACEFKGRRKNPAEKCSCQSTKRRICSPTEKCGISCLNPHSDFLSKNFGEDDECTNSHDTMKCLRTLGTPENMKRYVTKES